MQRLKFIAVSISCGLLLSASSVNAADPDGQGFPSPRAAAKALLDAAKSNEVSRLVEVLGPSAKEILVTNDSVADQAVRRRFVELASQHMRIANDRESLTSKTLLVGKEEWPLPIPIVRKHNEWFFDLAQGKREILARRIGGNELDAIEVCRGYVEAQNDYADRTSAPHESRHYAEKIISTPGQHDGLYWKPANPEDNSPIADIVSRAFAEGYTNRHQPYHGYYFKILTGQGTHATGGRMSYLQGGQMTKGFALMAWPSEFGSTGIMTFIVDKSGIVFQKNLGKDTSKLVGEYRDYDPDESWSPVATVAQRFGPALSPANRLR
jgi:hypothetical protein